MPAARPPMLLPFITLPNWVKAAAACGIHIEGIFRELGIDTDLLHVESATISPAQLEAVMARCVAASAEKHFPFVLGETFDFDYLPDLESFVTTSPTLRDALQVFDWVQVFINPMLDFRLVEAGDSARLLLRFTDLPDAVLPRPWFSEALFASVLRFGRLLAADDPFFRRLHFRHPPPDYADAYAHFFRLPVRFGAPEYAIEGRREALDRPLPGAFPALHAQARERIARRLRLLRQQSGAVAEVSRVVRQDPGLLRGGIAAVAAALERHPRRLQRQLQAEGERFGALQDRLRFELAREWLSEEGHSIEAIAEALGFSDRRSFTRAFGRWSGLSPRAWRSRQGQGG